MGKIVTTEQAIKISKELRKEGKHIVLVGGCFDIIHIGHINFLKKAKEKGDCLMVLLESDTSVRKLKGKGRPINSQQDRAAVLSSFLQVNFVVLLPLFTKDSEYDEFVSKIKPHVLATTEGDPNIVHKTRQANKVLAKVITVRRIPQKSTSQLAKLLYNEVTL